MKVLQLCNKPPYPPTDGGTIAMNSITQGLIKSNISVRVLSAYSFKHPFKETQLTPEYKEQTNFQAIFFNLKLNPFKALYYMLCGKSYHIERFKNKAFESALIKILEEETFDIVQLESLFMTPYVETIRKYTKAKIVLRSHNVEHKIWERITKCTKNPFKKFYLKHVTLMLKKYELAHLNKYDAIACISQPDADFFTTQHTNTPICVIPFGLDFIDMVEHAIEEPNSLFHIGSMNWQPNIEGIDWFLNNVWQKVRQKTPEAKLYLAGRNMPLKLLKSNYPNVKVFGEISDAMYFMSSKQINVVPLLSGSGIRVKIIEAMSIGKTVITTSIGSEGICCTHKKDILIANTPDEFAEAIDFCIKNPEECKKIGHAAIELIHKEHSNEKITKNLIELYQSIL